METMEKYIGKRYKLKTSENFEEYLKFLGIGLFSRKAVMAVSPVAVLTLNEDETYTFTLTTAIRTSKITFKLGEEFTEERADGVKVKSLMTVEGNELIQTQTEENGRQSKHVRIYTPQNLTVITTADGWPGKCVRVYECI